MCEHIWWRKLFNSKIYFFDEPKKRKKAVNLNKNHTNTQVYIDIKKNINHCCNWISFILVSTWCDYKSEWILLRIQRQKEKENEEKGKISALCKIHELKLFSCIAFPPSIYLINDFWVDFISLYFISTVLHPSPVYT